MFVDPHEGSLRTSNERSVAAGAADDDEITIPKAEFDALIQENEMMLVEIDQLKSRAQAAEGRHKQLEEVVVQQREEIQSLQDLCSSNGDKEAEIDDLSNRIEDLVEENRILRETVEDAQKETEAEIQRRSPPPDGRMDRILRELKTFAKSQQVLMGSLKQCSIGPNVPRDRYSSEIEKSSAMVKKVLDSSKRNTPQAGHSSTGAATASNSNNAVVPEDDEIVHVVKALVGELSIAAVSALQDSLQTIANVCNIVLPPPSTPHGSAVTPRPDGAKKGGIGVDYWQKK